MTENASGGTGTATPTAGPSPTLTDDQRTVWDVNHLIERDRDDLLDEIAPAATPDPVRRGTQAAHRVVLRMSRRR